MKLGVLLLCLALINSSSLADTVRFKHYTRADSLSQNVINDIAQDEQGFLWFATQNGLNRFDGFTFEKFVVTNDNNINALSANYIRSLYFQAPHYLWIGYDTKGISRFDLKSGEIKNIDLSTPFGSHNANVIKEITSCDDNIWVASLAGITIIDKHDAIIKDQRVLPQNSPLQSINTIYKDNQGRCLVGTAKGLFVLENNVFTPLIDNLHITTIFQNDDDTYWFGTNNGLYTSLGGVIEDSIVKPVAIKLDNLFITDITELSSGDLWVATRTSGIFTHQKEHGNWQQIQHHSSAPSSLINDNINKIFIDNVNNLWIATSGGGLSQYSPDKAKLGHINDESFNANFNNDVRAISVDNGGYVWLGTNKGLFRWHRESNQLLNTKQLGLPEHFSREFITFIHIDSRNFMWVGTLNSGLYRGALGSNDFKQYLPVEGNDNSFPGNRPITIFEDSSNNIWIGTFHNGLALYSPKGDKFTRFQQGKGLSDISHNKVPAIAEDNQGQIWIASHGEGISILNKSSLEVEKLTKSSHGIIDNVINSIEKDQHGRMWLATDLGLSLVDYDNNHIQNFTTGVGLTDNILYSLQLDHQSNLWIGTNSGMIKFNTNTFSVEAFGEQDGTQHQEFNTTAKTIDQYGRIYLGGLNGFNQFIPSTVTTVIQTPKVEFNQFYLQNKKLESQASLPASPLIDRASYSKNLSIKTSDLLDIGFAAFNVKNPENINFYYRLLPLDNEWYPVQKGKNSASYYRLPEGDYQFEVKATYNQGTDSSSIKTLALTVIAPWWQTKYAYTVYIAMVLLVIALIFVLIYRKRQIELTYYKQIHESQQRLSLALWGSGDSLWHWNINKGEVVREQIFKDKTIPHTTSFSLEALADFVHPEDLSRVRESLINTINGDIELYQVDYRMKGPEDQWNWVLDRGQVNEFDDKNKAIEIVGTTQDISKLKKAQTELFELNNELEQRVETRTLAIELSNKQLANTIEQLEATKNKLVQMEKMSALTNLVCGIAHEINTPLSIVKTSLTFLQEEDEALTSALESGKLSREKFTRYKENSPQANKLCIDNVNKAIKLIDEFKRISIREHDYNFEKINLSNLIETIIKSYEFKASSMSVKLNYILPQDLFIHSSIQAIEDVLAELIDNSLQHAFQYSLPNDNNILIELVEHNEEYTILQYQDNGCGLNPENTEHVFEPFNSNCLGTEGLGLGLNMAYNIITSILDGEIQQLDSPTGTCFRLIVKNRHDK
ncbi:two-component regulator propeller domain-containing protein [Colwellia psychrerythraea]|uniref:histidine kinase n=1 Tax=Colwellia psychrerythraea TaxID=28229 RepID=A0A099KZK0_COLPS|nr:two-component regulator propeller domain-containing protein [Colwellia psychrerythraea]KGJ95058.1 PAS/PAC sensor signal transduction histidine kinase [Colwellia psychrerythraea]